MFIFHNAAVSKNILSWTKYHLDMLEIIILQLKKNQGDVLEQDIELCPFCYLPVTIAEKEEGKFLCKNLGFHILLFVAFLFLLKHKN
jgi:hypothetical protein